MFHVEPKLIDNWASERRSFLTGKQKEQLNLYAEAVLGAGRRFNLTGFKNLEDIITNLVIGSINPVCRLNVPRGTLFADIGTGAGVPGVPISILFPESRFVLVDSNRKKISFIEKIAAELNLDNVEPICSRLEEFSRDSSRRESFDWVISRGLAAPYVCFELGAPLMKVGGHLLIYSREKAEGFNKEIVSHSQRLGLVFEDGSEYAELVNEGLLMSKTSPTSLTYPRAYPVIKRESGKVE